GPELSHKRVAGAGIRLPDLAGRCKVLRIRIPGHIHDRNCGHGKSDRAQGSAVTDVTTTPLEERRAGRSTKPDVEFEDEGVRRGSALGRGAGYVHVKRTASGRANGNAVGAGVSKWHARDASAQVSRCEEPAVVGDQLRYEGVARAHEVRLVRAGCRGEVGRVRTSRNVEEVYVPQGDAIGDVIARAAEVRGELETPEVRGHAGHE